MTRGPVQSAGAEPTEPAPKPAHPTDYEQLRSELVRAVSAAVEALGCRLEQEQQAQWQTLREEIEKRLADLVIVPGETGPNTINRNGRRARPTQQSSSSDDHAIEPPTLDAGNPPPDS
jgi:hypothetical protein